MRTPRPWRSWKRRTSTSSISADSVAGDVGRDEGVGESGTIGNAIAAALPEIVDRITATHSHRGSSTGS